MLRHGANPDLRDEDGKTPLDKARERNDQGHREVSAILQSPGELMCSGSSLGAVNSALDSLTSNGVNGDQQQADGSSGAAPAEPQGDLAVAPVFLRSLIPVLCQIEQHSLVRSVQRSALNLLRKMLHYIDAALLTEMSSGELAPMLAGVISQVIDAEQEHDQDTLLIALQMVRDVLSKARATYMDYFSRLGVLSKIEALANSGLQQQQLLQQQQQLQQAQQVALQQQQNAAACAEVNGALAAAAANSSTAPSFAAAGESPSPVSSNGVAEHQQLAGSESAALATDGRGVSPPAAGSDGNGLSLIHI